MAKKFSELRQKMSPERRRTNKAESDRMLLEMSLQELRQRISNLNQSDVAEMLQVNQR